MVDLYSALVTTLMGILGVAVGAIISNYVNQKIARQSTKKDLVMKKKIEYFEKIVDSIGNNLQLYRKFIKKAEKIKSGREAERILEELKNGRKKFELMASPLYLDTRPISVKIKQFTGIEKSIFADFESLSKPNAPQKDIIHSLKIRFADLEKSGNSLILGFRQSLLKE